MRFSLVLCLAVAGWLTHATVSEADPFSLDRASVPRLESGTTDRYGMVVLTSGDAPATDVIKNPANWVVTTHEKGKTPSVVTIEPPAPGADAIQWTKGAVTLHLRAASLPDPRTLLWNVLFIGDHRNLVTAPRKPPTRRFKAADTKDDADLYASGSFLAAHGSAPIWSLDAKGVWIRELTAAEKPDDAWWDFGITGGIAANQDAKPLATRTALDFNSIAAGTVFRNTRPVNTNAVLSAWLIDVPVNAEFTKDTEIADLVGAIHVKAALKPAGAFAFYPWIGYEIGLPFRRPTTVADQPVDLSSWSWISRAVGGGIAELYFFKSELTGDDPSRLTFDLAVTARMPLVAEPFAFLQTVSEDQITVTTLRKNARADVKLAVSWNIAEYIGAQVQYKYGSLPPLFQFVDHQVTVGLTFKTKYATRQVAVF